MYQFNDNSRTSYRAIIPTIVFNQKHCYTVYNAERDLLAIATFLIGR